MAAPGTSTSIADRPDPPVDFTDTGVWLLVGTAERGPTTKALEIRSMSKLALEYGDRQTSSLLHDAARVAFAAGARKLIVARAGTTLAVMTPAAFQEFARVAAAVHEARLEEQHLRAGLGLVILGNLQAFGRAEAQPLPTGSISVLRKAL